MSDLALPTQAPRSAEDARDLQARLYREIGITAVAAALRFTTQPDPVKWPTYATKLSDPRPEGLAA